MEKPRSVKKFVSAIMALLICLTSLGGLSGSVLAQTEEQDIIYSDVEVSSPYYSEQQITFQNGQQLTRSTINGPSKPLDEFQEEREASIIKDEPTGTIANFPSYDWVYGCSAVSAAMIAAYYDRGDYSNLYKGPTDNGVMPLTDTGWPVWSDGYDQYPSNPLIASRNGTDGRTTRGSINDYWVRLNHTGPDPFVTGGWSEHQWNDAIGDFMKTSQANYGNADGATSFYTWSSNPDPLTCADMVSNGIANDDGTYGRKLFYEARGYTVTDCYNQRTDNNQSGGFTFAKFKSEIDDGHPVLLNLEGHSIVGYGYSGNTVYIRDTWDSNPGNVYSMSWDGSYQGMALKSVSIVRLKPIGTGPVFSGSVYLPLIQKPAPAPVGPTTFLNPGFEEGHVYWSEYSRQGWELIIRENNSPVLAHNGDWLTWLGGDENEYAEISQNIYVSSSSPYLRLWFYVASQDACSYDYFYIFVDDELIGWMSLCQNNNTNGWVEDWLDLRSYAGNRTISFLVITDGSLNSNLFLDDIRMSSSTLKSSPVPMNETILSGLEKLTKSEVLGK